jgi:PAS domain S-box-containing protein
MDPTAAPAYPSPARDEAAPEPADPFSGRSPDAEATTILERLAAERARLAAIIEHMPVGVLIAEAPSGRLILGNRKLVEIWRHRSIASTGIDDPGRYIGFHPDGRMYAPHEWPLARALANGETVTGEEIEILRGDGTRGTIEVGAAPVRANDGTITAAVVTFTDVTERKSAEEAMRFLAAIVESSDDAIIGKTIDGVITSWNRAAERIYGYTAEEALGRNISIIIPPELPDELPAIMDRLCRGERIDHYVTTRLHKNGTRIRTAITASPIRDANDRIIGASTIARDITEQERAEAELRATEERLRIAQELSLDGFMILRSIRDHAARIVDFEIEYANPRAGRILGHPPDALVGRRLLAILPELLHRRDIFERFVHVAETGEPHDLELHFDADGIRGWFRAMTVRLGDGIAISLSDITERKRVEEEQRFLSDATALLSSSLDYEATLRSVTRLAASRIADLCCITILEEDRLRVVEVAHRDPRLEALARRIFQRYPPDPAAPDGIARVIRTGEPCLAPEITEERLRAAARDDEHFRAIAELGFRSGIIVPLVARGRTLGTISLVASDGRRPFDERDLATATELAGRAALAIDNAALYHQAKAASRAKSQFLATISHELRTPLNAVICYTDLLETGIAGPLNDQQRHHLERIAASSRHLLHLIDEVLSFASIDVGKVEVRTEPVDVAALAREVASLIRPTADRKGIGFRVHTPDRPIPVETDPGKLRQILLNLLSNAVKFTDDGEVALRVAPEPDGDILLEVRDTGIGIAPEDMDRIFEPFEQARAIGAAARGGTGLGLSVSRNLARLLGSDLLVESEVGQGSTFTIRLAPRPRARLQAV